jgi:hypothetical protein
MSIDDMHQYNMQEYAHAFIKAGFEPIYLPCNNIWVLKRPIPNTELFDAIGCYPITPFIGSVDFKTDQATLVEHNIVSVVLVTDVLNQPSYIDLVRSFHYVMEYKEHYIYDVNSEQQSYSKHHLAMLKKAKQGCEVKLVELADYLDTWYSLYSKLITKHSITGIQAFEYDYFLQLVNVRGLVTCAAFKEDNIVSMHIWLRYKNYLYSHLAASNDIGYQVMASYAIYDFAISYAKNNNCSTIDLGGGAGANTASKGLVFFKKGFANKIEHCHIAGYIANHDAYHKLSSNTEQSNFFPLYRAQNIKEMV